MTFQSFTGMKYCPKCMGEGENKTTSNNLVHYKVKCELCQGSGKVTKDISKKYKSYSRKTGMIEFFSWIIFFPTWYFSTILLIKIIDIGIFAIIICLVLSFIFHFFIMQGIFWLFKIPSYEEFLEKLTNRSNIF
jgi:hypothetical protein